jgi:predicted NAD-dependent protein-ADP-ribosyltransferase YbiA (DUF1768 family)
MRVIFKSNHLILVPQSEDEAHSLAAWRAGQDGRVYQARSESGRGLALRDLGPREQACQVPINVWSKSPDPLIRLISNFATTPFELDGRRYRSVESFWQSLTSDEPGERARIADLDGPQAKRAGQTLPDGACVNYEGQSIPVGTWQHWELMKRACWAKFTQSAEARSALLGTAGRPLSHRVRRDSRTIPGVIMADIWMRIRRDLPSTPEDERAETMH